jgi:hypothetical protein
MSEQKGEKESEIKIRDINKRQNYEHLLKLQKAKLKTFAEIK